MELWLTGAGMVTSVGADKRACFENFCRGETGLAPLQAFDRGRFNVKNAYEIKDRCQGEVPFRASKWLCHAINEAVREAGLNAQTGNIAVIVGTGLRELRSLELLYADSTPMRPQQLHFAEAIRQKTSVRGAVYTLSNACAASNCALALAEDMIRLGEAEVVITAGCDSITESMFGLLDRVNPEPPERLQVFDQRRKGVIMGEGASAVVLESAEHAARRGAQARAQLLGVGISCDAKHETAPDREGVLRAMRDAHRRAGTDPTQIDVIFAHGTGTTLNDKTEAEALTEFFPPAARNFVISGIKSMTGHTSGASGLVGVITAMLSLESDLIPPTVGLNEPIPEIDSMTVATRCIQRANLQRAQINAFGFGGVNSVVILGGVKS